MPRAKTRDRAYTEAQEKLADAALVRAAPDVPYSIKIPVSLAIKLKRRTERLGATFTSSWAERLTCLLRAVERPGE
jgi:hypothetical protein